MTYDVVIVGAGPGGLACAQVTAAHGLSTLVIERNVQIGRKVCAGGITWNGLLKHLETDITEKQFNTQYIHTRRQRVKLVSDHPIIATVDRQLLGRHMAGLAEMAGAEIFTGCRVVHIDGDSLNYRGGRGGGGNLRFKTLVGADGSTSLVRRSLLLPVQRQGVGINYTLPTTSEKMLWHLDSTLFKSGYGWVFPHRNSVSVGGYADLGVMAPKMLQLNLISWAEREGFSLKDMAGQAGFINFDFRGYRFGNRYLVGDAAGFASGFTGEGIYPAIVSGKEVAFEICGAESRSPAMQRLIRLNSFHRRLVLLAGKSRLLSGVLSELFTYLLKKGFIDFSDVEMAR
jgi:flavin-dependent dehydrogenase